MVIKVNAGWDYPSDRLECVPNVQVSPFYLIQLHFLKWFSIDEFLDLFDKYMNLFSKQSKTKIIFINGPNCHGHECAIYKVLPPAGKEQLVLL